MATKSKTILIAVGLAVLAIVIVVVAINGPKKWRQRKQKLIVANADMAMAREEFEEAEKRYLELLEYLPKSGAVMIRLSEACTRQHKYDEAREWVDKSASVSPKEARPKFQKVTIHRREAAHIFEGLDATAPMRALAKVDQLCGQAAKLLEEVGETVGASPVIQAEEGRIWSVRADSAGRRADLLQDQADRARRAGKADQVAAFDKQAVEWRAKFRTNQAAAIKELTAAAKLAPKDMKLAEEAARVQFDARRWSDVIVAYRTATTLGRPTAETIVLATRATLAAVVGKGGASHRQACQLAREMLTQGMKSFPFNVQLKLESAAVELAAGQLDAAEAFLTKTPASAKSSPEAVVPQARLLLARGKPAEAAKLLESVPADAPNVTDAKLICSEAVGRTDQPDRSLALLREAVALDPHRSEARIALARALTDRGMWDRGVEQLAAGLRRDPADLMLVRELCRASVRLGQPDRLAKLIKATEQAAKDDRGKLRELALLCLGLGRADWAYRIVAESLKGDPKAPITRTTTAATQMARGNVDDILKVLGPLGARNDQVSPIYLMLAQAYIAKGHYHQADAVLERAIVADESDDMTALRAADLYASGGMLEKATRVNEQLVSECPESPAARLQAIRLALSADALPDATESLTALHAAGWRAKTPDEKGIEHLLAGRYAKAVAAVKGRKDADSRLIGAWALVKLGQRDKGIAELEAAIRVNPGLTPLYLRLAEQSVAAGSSEKGLARLNQLAELDRANAALGAGRIHELKGRYDKALETYEGVLSAKVLKIDKCAEGELRLAVGKCYRRQGRLQDEMKVYQKMQQDRGTGLKGLRAGIDWMIRHGHVKRVAGMLDQFTASQTGSRLSADMLSRIAEAYRRIGESAKAAEAYDRIVGKLPDALWPRRAKARMYESIGQAGQAVEEIRQALRRRPGNRALLRDLANACVRAGQFSQALETLAVIARANPKEAGGPDRDRAMLMGRLGLSEAAVPELTRILASPERVDFAAALVLGQCLGWQGKQEPAVKRLSSIPTTSRHYGTARVLMASLERERGRDDRAVQILTEATSKAPDSDGLRQALFEMKLRAGQIDEAVALAGRYAADAEDGALRWAISACDAAALRSALDRQPGSRAVAIRLAACLLAQGDWKGAEAALAPPKPTTTRAATSRPKPGPGAECLLALAEMAGGKAPAGMARLDTLLRRKDLPPAWRDIAVIARLASEKGAPVEQLRKTVGTHAAGLTVDELAGRVNTPAGRQACRNIALSMVAERLRMPVLAYRCAGAAVQADKDNVAANVALLDAMRDLDAGRTETANKLADDIVKRFGKSLLAREVAVSALLYRGEYDKALAATKAWDKAGGVPAELAYQLGSAALAKEKKTDALRWFEHCLKQSPDHVAAANNVAYLLVETKGQDTAALDRALKLAEETLRRRGWAPSVGETLGWILTKRDKAETGLPILQRAIIPLASDLRGHYHIGLAYEAVGKAEMARLHLTHVAAGKDKALADQARKALQRLGPPAKSTTKRAA